jgi:hypothetical protein
VGFEPTVLPFINNLQISFYLILSKDTLRAQPTARFQSNKMIRKLSGCCAIASQLVFPIWEFILWLDIKSNQPQINHLFVVKFRATLCFSTNYSSPHGFIAAETRCTVSEAPRGAQGEVDAQFEGTSVSVFCFGFTSNRWNRAPHHVCKGTPGPRIRTAEVCWTSRDTSEPLSPLRELSPSRVIGASSSNGGRQ